MGRRRDDRGQLTRRELVKYGAYGAAGMLFCADEASAQTAAPAQAPPKPKAKSVIQIWMWGGPCHIDTFDPKPKSGAAYSGPYVTPASTNVDGMQVCQMLPLLAKQADKYSLIRSMTHGDYGHETAAYVVQTGHTGGDGQVYPGLGSIVSLIKGYNGGYKGLIPPYVVLTQLQGRFSESGFLGNRASPFATGGDPNGGRFVVEGITTDGITELRQRNRRDLLQRLNSLEHAMKGDSAMLALGKCETNSYDLMLGDAGKVFDLSQEKDAVREGYGRNTFGQSCLAARRLVEQGVPYVTINYPGWDTHKEHFQAMQNLLPQLDKGLSTLLIELSERGLLDTTIVWCSGEFGRTPLVAMEEPWNGGRHHWGPVFANLIAGGGFKGGHVLGATGPRGEEVTDRPVHPSDLIHSVFTLMGIDPDATLPHPQGLSLPAAPPRPKNIQTAGPIVELI